MQVHSTAYVYIWRDAQQSMSWRIIKFIAIFHAKCDENVLYVPNNERLGHYKMLKRLKYAQPKGKEREVWYRNREGDGD